MKRTIHHITIKTLMLLMTANILGGSMGAVFAADTNISSAGYTNSFDQASDAKTTTIYTSEDVPGGHCKCVDTVDNKCENITTRKYMCTITKGLDGFQGIFSAIIRWVINITLLLAVLAIAALGIMWSFSGGDDAAKKWKLKWWAVNLMIGLAILFFFRWILTMIAPWIYQ